ncbi:MAG: DUF3667 domain-containing protein [Pseudomonadota bacterium]
MINEIETSADPLHAGPVAAQVEGGAAAHDQPAPHGKQCLNCGEPLAGAYCSACGQSGHVHRSLLHLVEELLHGVLHFDAKGWRTVPLLVAFPGRLTRRYIDGQRTRFVSPLALFLFMTFLMFFVASLGDVSNVNGTPADNQAAHASLSAAIQSSKEDAAKAEAALLEARKTGKGVAAAEARLKAARNDEQITELALLSADKLLPAGKDANTGSTAASQGLSRVSIDTGIPFLDRALRHALQNPELTFYKLKSSTYKLSFMLIPISLPFLWLMFIARRDIGMYDHAVFSLYSLSFMALWFIVVLLCAFAALGDAIAPLFCIPPLHMFLQLRDTYRLGIWSALWRTVALLFVAGAVFLLFLALIFAVTVH